MSNRSNFSHLSLPLVLAGKPKLKGMSTPDKRTNKNRENRVNHGGYIKRKASELSNFWKKSKKND